MLVWKMLLQFYYSCWISAGDPRMGAVWAFALPMLVVIIINTGFLIAALVTLYRVRNDRIKKIKIGKKPSVKESAELFRYSNDKALQFICSVGSVFQQEE